MTFLRTVVILLGYRGLGAFRYTWTGEFLDREAWARAILSKGAYGSVLGMAERLIKNANGRPPTELVERASQGHRPNSPSYSRRGPQDPGLGVELRGVCMDAKATCGRLRLLPKSLGT